MKTLVSSIFVIIFILAGTFSALADEENQDSSEITKAQILYHSIIRSIEDLIQNPSDNFPPLALTSFSLLEKLIEDSNLNGYNVSFLTKGNDDYYLRKLSNISADILCTGILDKYFGQTEVSRHSAHAALLLEKMKKYLNKDNLLEYTEYSPEEVSQYLDILSGSASLNK